MSSVPPTSPAPGLAAAPLVFHASAPGPADDAGGWRFAELLAAPHRLAFSAAALLLAGMAAWWALVQGLAEYGVPVHWALPPAVAHGVPMTFGFLPLFFTGFLFTAGPKWLRQPAVPASELVVPVLAQLSGWGVFGLAVHGRDAAFGAVLGTIGLAAVATGATAVAGRFAHLVGASTVEDRTHATLLALALALAAALLWLAVPALAASRFDLVAAIAGAALRGAVGLVFVVAAHRLVPFLSAGTWPWMDARRPRWLLEALVALVAVEAVAGFLAAVSPEALRPVAAPLAVAEIAAGTGLLALAVRWARVQSLTLRLIAMLHAGFAWLGLSVLIAGASRAMALATDGSRSLGLAPLHAFAAGFIGTTFLAMVTRVAAGHEGRTVAADEPTWRLFLVLQLAIVLRVAGGVLAAVGDPAAQALVAASAIGWAGVFVAWGARLLWAFGQPRPGPRR